MKRWLPILPFIALALDGLVGAATGVIELRRAVSRSQDLYRLDTVGSQIESDLEFQAQESRRAFLYALAVTDPNQQLPFVDAAREADRQVRDTIGRFRRLNAPEDIARSLGDFEKSWGSYARTRDAVMAGILIGDSQAAMRLDQREGTLNFAAALQNLGSLKQALQAHAKSQSAQLNRTLKNCILGLAFFVFGTCCIMFALLRVNRARAAVMRTLASTNQTLERTQELDRRRLAILEMVGTHAPLADTLAAIAELPAQWQAGAGAALWSAAGDKLLYQVSFGLPEHVTNVLRSQPFERVEGSLILGAEARKELVGLAARAGLREIIIPLRNVTGDAIGLLLIFTPPQIAPPRVENSQGVSAQMTRLASLAIENSLLYERLAFQAQHDVLTGLPNRLLFQDRVQQAILRAQRNRRKVALLWFDLDRFKQVNDTLGHRMGDELLAECARRLKGSLRESDTAARIGGDEFVVLAGDLESAADVQIIAAKIIKNIRMTTTVSGHEMKISASAGVSVYPEHGADPATLMRNADLAMYQAKRFGRDTFQVFDKQLGDSLGRRLEIESELQHAIENGELQMKYQPLIGRRNELDGFEALLRWDNRKLGSVSPAEFIPIAEESGLILQIGEWVTRTVCRTGAEWLRAGIEVPRIAINASGVQFADPGFADKVHAALTESGFPATKLELEVTETALVGNLDSALKQIAQLRELGITFAIDDFGTGYSSLNQLRTLPVDCVKVDRSFIKDLERMTGDSTTLVRGIIGLAHNLRLTVVGEGVETPRQLEILRSLGCDLIQGFYLHRPLSVDAAEDLMRLHMARSRAEEALPSREVESMLVIEPSLA
jgi:diguanylate cyclase (GGDEF)-like protein